MQINPLLIVVLTGLFAAYLWRENRILLRHMARLTREASTQESSRRYKEIFDNASDAVFVVEVLRRGKFRFESLNHAAVLAICPRGSDLGDYCFDETAKFRNDAGLTLILAELSGQLRGCLVTGLPAEYESAFRVSPDEGQKNYHIKLIPMADDGGISHILCFAQDITALKETERQLKETQNKLRELVISRESLIEGERKRIAWEMHEELGQQLAAMNLRVCSMRSQQPKSIPSLDENSRIIVGLINKSIETVREIVSDLRPTALLYGTVAALEWLVAEFNKHPDMVCKLEVDEDGTPVSDELTTLVFRIVQESLENIVRHTGVSSVSVSWTSNRSGQCLAIRHDGKSFSPELTGDKSLSFFGMQERVSAFGGEMKIFDMLEHGTVIKVRFQVRGMAEIQYPLFVE